MSNPQSDLPSAVQCQLEAILFRGGDAASRTVAFDQLAAEHPSNAAAIRAWARQVLGLGDGRLTEPPPELPGYRAIAKLGEGGFGEVWRCEQLHPVQREVAVKVLKLGMDSAAILKRFAREQEALARMSHDAIARIHDAGLLATGQPFFVMELVDGAPITDWCERERLSLMARLELFVEVCHGVQHAHQKGMVHRDLKPSNVLVSKAGDRTQPKLIDFGISRALEQSDGSVQLTEQGMMLGTPAYMAPEQARGDVAAIDTRTDVYALGAILFELLTGRQPHGDWLQAQASPWEMRQHILDGHTPRPSATVLGADKQPATWLRRLRGDLDWIVLKAMAKESEHRYASAAELAADVERHLRLEPVLAGPPSRSYRLKKFVRRYRVQVGAVAAVLVTAVAGALVSWRWAREAEANAARADVNAQTSQEKTVQLIGKIAEFDRLALVVRLERAVAEERALVPPWPERLGAMQHWLSELALPLLTMREPVRDVVAELTHRALGTNEAQHAALARLDPRCAQLDELRERRDALSAMASLGTAALPEAATAAASVEHVRQQVKELAGSGSANGAPVLTEEQLLADALQKVRAQLAKVEQEERALAVAIDGAVPLQFESQADSFLHTTMRELADGLARFELEQVNRVARRRSWAERVERATLQHPAAVLTWAEVGEQLAAPRADGSVSAYAGAALTLDPQLGLVPLGRNPNTGMFEFYHLLSAWDGEQDPQAIALPLRDAEGWIETRDDTGMVFVLLPGGACRYGSQREDPAGPHYDPAAAPDQQVFDGELRPFLLARHETSQAQWRNLARVAGQIETPSYYTTGTNIRLLSFTDRHPVENVSWHDARELLTAAGLSLPSEVQWEYACRAGSTSPWWCARRELVRCANLADKHFGVAAGRSDHEPWDDLYSLTAPVGVLRPNVFGLYDTHGNVGEWCSDESGRLGAALRPLDGRRTYGDGSGMRIVRGGFFSTPAFMAASGYRGQAASSVRSAQYGVRAMRVIAPAGTLGAVLAPGDGRR